MSFYHETTESDAVDFLIWSNPVLMPFALHSEVVGHYTGEYYYPRSEHWYDSATYALIWTNVAVYANIASYLLWGPAQWTGFVTLNQGLSAAAGSIPTGALAGGALAAGILGVSAVAANEYVEALEPYAPEDKAGQQSFWRSVAQALTGTGIGIGGADVGI